MHRPLQPQFKIRIFNGKINSDDLKGTKTEFSSKGGYIDIEKCVSCPVVYEEEANLLNTLRFTIDKFADVLIYYFQIGQSVTLYGGYYTDEQSGMQKVFSGTVTRIRTFFADSGRVSFSVECMNYGFTKMGKNFKNFVYPDVHSSRKFARSESLSVEEIVKGIAKDNNMEIGEVSLSTDAKNYRLDKNNIRYQKNMTDWKFLSSLAQDFGCNVWVSSEDGVDKLNFVSHQKAFDKQDKISFLFPLYGKIKDVLDSEVQKFPDPAYNRPRILREVSVEEDVSMAYAVSRSSVYFDKDTGEYKETISKIETDKDGKMLSMTFYELDESKVEFIHRTNPELADAIRNNGPSSMPWGTPDNPKNASYYYKATKVYDDAEAAVFDKAFFGITVTAKCNQDLNIRSQRTYRIRGILSYHSKDLNTSFFLRGLKHIWDNDGCWTELDFIR